MDIDLSQSDMSRLTTMLTKLSEPFDRLYGPNGLRGISIGATTFWFNDYGDLVQLDTAHGENTSKRSV